tara:strand:+ start:13628 stop:13849 length:222 start_codon:yes stop_codon:yes gene_type:complete
MVEEAWWVYGPPENKPHDFLWCERCDEIPAEMFDCYVCGDECCPRCAQGTDMGDMLCITCYEDGEDDDPTPKT